MDELQLTFSLKAIELKWVLFTFSVEFQFTFFLTEIFIFLIIFIVFIIQFGDLKEELIFSNNYIFI